MVEDMLWGVPRGSQCLKRVLVSSDSRLVSVQAQELVDFWQENFRIQVEARSGTLHLDNWPGITYIMPFSPRLNLFCSNAGQPPAKRRKVRASRPQGETNDDLIEPHDDFGNEIDVNMDMDIGMGGNGS